MNNKEKNYDGLKYISIAVIVLLLMWWIMSERGLRQRIKDLEEQVEDYKAQIEELETENKSMMEVMEYYGVY